jgi:small-conductance mechanosensitive channel
MLDWMAGNWLQVTIPIIAFLATYVVGLWLRRVVFATFVFWTAKRKWAGTSIVLTTVRAPFLLWFLLLGVTIGVQVSVIPDDAKSTFNRATWSLLALSVVWVFMTLGDRLLRFYMPAARMPERAVVVTSNVVRTVAVVVGALVVLEIWRVRTTPLLLLVLLAIAAAILVFRGVLPDLFATLQMSATPQFKVGDYIKLETGEEGYVEEFAWNITSIRSLDGSRMAIPNSRMAQRTVVNYGHPLKKAGEPFRFFSRLDLSELTGLRARNLGELLALLKDAPDGMVYYHTHHFLEEHHYLTPEPANDFALWVADTLGDDVLGEQLASVDTFSFPTLASLKDRLIGIIEEHVAGGSHVRDVEPGREFYFMKSVSVILDTPFRAHDLREFVENLRQASQGALFFHMFESRLRLARGQNDFSVWLQDSLGETELGEEIARLDPYTYSLEGLRSTLIQLIEKRIK